MSHHYTKVKETHLTLQIRPISIMSSLAKLLERIIFKYVFNHIKYNNLITSHQSGFQPNNSTVNQIISIYDIITTNLDKDNELRFVFCDISKAFARVLE